MHGFSIIPNMSTGSLEVMTLIERIVMESEVSFVKNT
jgi:hypothetical protein